MSRNSLLRSLWIWILALAGIILLAVSISPLSGAEGEKSPLSKEIFSRGERLYKKQCSTCHGLTGRGDGKAAYLLYPKPRDFTRREFRLISTSASLPTDQDLFKTLSRGMPGSSMPPWDFLSAEDRWALVYYVRYLSNLEEAGQRGEVTNEKGTLWSHSLSPFHLDEVLKEGVPWDIQKKLATVEVDPATVIQVAQEPEKTSESIQRGKGLFLRACAPCHGPEGRGDGRQMMQDSEGIPTRPRDLTSGVFKGEPTSAALYHRMTAGMPGTPMPSYKEAFTEGEIWDLIHFVQTLPAKGSEERARLSRTTLIAKKIEGAISLNNPSAPEWQTISSTKVVLTPLWWRDERIENVEVKAVHNGKEIALLVSWQDPTEDKSTVLPQLFSDGAAIQWSSEADPPFFGMGGESAVYIDHWKASWQEEMGTGQDIEHAYPHTAVDWYPDDKRYQSGDHFEAADSKTKFHDPERITAWGAGNPMSNPERQTAMEEAKAKGPGTLTALKPKVLLGEARGVWQEGRWFLVFRHAMEPLDEDGIEFQSGRKYSVAFAVWDGSAGDRDGQKSVSIWNELMVE